MNEFTVLSLARRHKWKKAVMAEGKDAGDYIAEACANSKKVSTVHLAKFVERAAIHAAEEEEPLKVTRQAKDFAYVHAHLWPREKSSGMIEGSILIGAALVVDAKPVTGRVLDAEHEPLRETLPDAGPASD